MPAKRGRKPGDINSPNPVREALKEIYPGKIRTVRTEQEFFQGTKAFSFKIDAISHAVLDIQRRRRGVPLTWLIQDILNLWIAAATDYDQAIFRELLPPKARAARCPERYPGYIESLGFAEAPQAPAAQAPEFPPQPPPQAIPASYAHQYPGGQATKSLADLAQAYVHPLTTGPASYPHPEPSLPHNAGVFNPEEHNRVAVPPTPRPQDELPPIDPALKELLDHYRVDPKDVR